MTPLPDKKYMQQTARSRVGVDDFDIYQHTGGRNHSVNRANDERFNNRNMQPSPDGRPVDVNHNPRYRSSDGTGYHWDGTGSWKKERPSVFKAGTPTDPAYYRPKTEKPAPVKFGNIQQGLKGLRSTPQNDKQMRGPKLSEGGYGLPPNPYSSYSTMASAQSGGQFSLPRRPLPAPSRPTTGRDIDPGFYKPMPKKPAPVDPGYVRPMPKKPKPPMANQNATPPLSPLSYNGNMYASLELREQAAASDLSRYISNNAQKETIYRPKPQDVEFIAGGQLRLRKPAPVTSAPVTSTVSPSVPAPSNLGPTPIYKRRNKAQNGMITNLI